MPHVDLTDGHEQLCIGGPGEHEVERALLHIDHHPQQWWLDEGAHQAADDREHADGGEQLGALPPVQLGGLAVDEGDNDEAADDLQQRTAGVCRKK